MKTLRNHTILYDAECPMCSLYTGAFIKCGMLDEKGRQQFNPSARSLEVAVDWERAGTEIALVDHRHKTVYYGIDSLFKILTHSFPVLSPLFRNRTFRFLIRHLYFFISYNRKVIAPSSVFEGWADCRPVMNIPYRIAYLLVAICLVSLAAAGFSGTAFATALAAVGIPLVVQAAAVCAIRKERLIYYLGNTMTVLLMASIASLPIILFSGMDLHQNVMLVWMAILTAIFAVVHHRRCRTLGIRRGITVTWLLTQAAGIMFLVVR